MTPPENLVLMFVYQCYTTAAVFNNKHKKGENNKTHFVDLLILFI